MIDPVLDAKAERDDAGDQQHPHDDDEDLESAHASVQFAWMDFTWMNWAE